MKKNLLKLVLLLLPFFIYGQKSKITFLDELSKKPIIGLQIFSGTGSFISNTNSMGEFELDMQLLQQENVKNIMGYNTDYFSQEYKLNKIPTVIYLKKSDYIQLDAVVVKARASKEYFTLKGFFRSWQLINGKLVKYGDGLVDYHMPYANVDNDFNTGVKSYMKAYRTFKGDSIKQRLKIIKAPPLDGYLDVSYIPKNDILKRERKRYNVKKSNDNASEIFKEDKNIGFVIYDENNNPSLINTSTHFEADEVVKVYFGKVTGKWNAIEKWTGEGDTRHPLYIYSSSKTIGKIKNNGKMNYIETITEIFIEDDIIYNDKKPEKYKSMIDRDKSFYNSNYWDEQLLKHPLPSEIKSQLTKVNENKNTY